MTDTTVLLSERYGSRQRARGPRFWWLVAAVGIALGTAAVVYTALTTPSASIEYSAPRYVAGADGGVDVTVTVTMAPGSTARCAVQVLGDGQSTVGWKYVDIPASTEYTQSVVVSVRVVQTAIAASVPQCWVL